MKKTKKRYPKDSQKEERQRRKMCKRVTEKMLQNQRTPTLPKKHVKRSKQKLEIKFVQIFLN